MSLQLHLDCHRQCWRRNRPLCEPPIWVLQIIWILDPSLLLIYRASWREKDEPNFIEFDILKRPIVTLCRLGEHWCDCKVWQSDKVWRLDVSKDLIARDLLHLPRANLDYIVILISNPRSKFFAKLQIGRITSICRTKNTSTPLPLPRPARSGSRSAPAD